MLDEANDMVALTPKPVANLWAGARRYSLGVFSAWFFIRTMKMKLFVTSAKSTPTLG
jgi:hypothetical protein